MTAALAPGARIGQYRLTRPIGQGGMGVVYEAVHVEIGQRAAVKVLSPRCADDPRYVGRFLNEAKAVSRVRHPGLVQIYDFGQTPGGEPYILMELLEGETLRARMERRAAAGERWGAEELCRVGRQIAAALAATHQAAVIHRDLKPENVMLVADEEAPGGERVKLLDFGIARFVDSDDATLTAPGTAIGTIAYMSPEQCAGELELTGAVDVYALGVMLYELWAGARPFAAAEGAAVMRMHVTAAPPPLPPGTPPRHAKLVADMLAKEVTLRPAMREVAERLADGGGATPAAAPAVAASAADPDATEELRRPASTPAPAGDGSAAQRRAASVVETTGDVSAAGFSAAPPRRGQRGPALAIGAVVIAAAAAWPVQRWVRGAGGREPGAAAPSVSEPPAQLADMVWFPGGAFRMGRTAPEIEQECQRIGETCRREMLDREQPAHRVTLSPFYLDRYEATNDDVARWLTSLRTSIVMRADEEHGVLRWATLDGKVLVDLLPPGAGIARTEDGSFAALPGREREPIGQITWDGASQYCINRGKRLPTEAEWERAAAGVAGRRYPWGEQPAGCDEVVFGRTEGKPCQRPEAEQGPLFVGVAPLDRTPEGVHDLGGNVAEWVQDQFTKPYYPACEPCVDPVVQAEVPLQDDTRVVRGGSWGHSLALSRTSSRGRWKRVEVLVNAGMRCASR